MANPIKTTSVSAGAIIMVGMRWMDRLVGLVSTLILARLLAPDDFGIIAMASVVIGLIDVMLDVGVATALIQNAKAGKEDYDVAWTLRLIQSTIAAVLILGLSGPAATYYHNAQVAPVMQALAFATFLSGLENIGIVAFQKHMEFGRDFRFFFIKRIGGFVVTVLCAYLLRDYWALVFGTIAGRLVGVAASYVMHPMRPSFRFAGMKSILSFSTWNLLRGIAGALNDSIHRIIVGRRASAVIMGEYTLASEISALPSTELLAPLGRVLFPAFVNLKDNPAELRRAFLLALGIQALVGIPAGAGTALVAPELVMTMLGEKWMGAAPFIQIMGAINIIAALNTSSCYVLLAHGRAKVIAVNGWLQVIVFVIGALLLFPEQGAMGIAMLRLAVVVGGLLSFIYLVQKELPDLDAASLLGAVWRPCAASALMSLILVALPMPGGLPAVFQLFIKVMLGASSFAAALLALWVLSGRPGGAESYLLDKSKAWFRTRLQRA
jgi:lipopolysaccharide exporter